MQAVADTGLLKALLDRNDPYHPHGLPECFRNTRRGPRAKPCWRRRLT